MIADHGWVHETQPTNVDGLGFAVLAVGAALIALLIIKHLWDNDR